MLDLDLAVMNNFEVGKKRTSDWSFRDASRGLRYKVPQHECRRTDRHLRCTELDVQGHAAHLRLCLSLRLSHIVVKICTDKLEIYACFAQIIR